MRVDVSSSGDARTKVESEEEAESESDAVYDDVGGTVMTALATVCSLSALMMVTLNVYLTAAVGDDDSCDDGNHIDDAVGEYVDSSACMLTRAGDVSVHVYVAPFSFMLVYAASVTCTG